jgi:hypothetical protein
MSHSAAVDDKNFVFARNSSLRSQFSIFNFQLVLPGAAERNFQFSIFNFQLVLPGAAERNFQFSACSARCCRTEFLIFNF